MIYRYINMYMPEVITVMLTFFFQVRSVHVMRNDNILKPQITEEKRYTYTYRQTTRGNHILFRVPKLPYRIHFFFHFITIINTTLYYFKSFPSPIT